MQSDVVGHHCFKGSFCLHYRGKWSEDEAAWSSKMLVSFHFTTWHHNSEDYDFKLQSAFSDT